MFLEVNDLTEALRMAMYKLDGGDEYRRLKALYDKGENLPSEEDDEVWCEERT